MFKNLKIRGKLMVLSIPLIVALAVMAIVYTSMMQYVYTTSEDMFYEQLYNINKRLTNADRDFYQAYCAILRNVMGQAFQTGNLEMSRAEFKENSDQAWDQVNEVNEIVKSFPELEAYEYDGMTMHQQFDEFVKYEMKIAEALQDGITLTSLQGFVPAFNGARDALNNMEEIIQAFSEKEKTQLEKRVRNMAIVLFVVVIAVAIATAFIAIRMIQYIKNNLMKITKDIQSIAQKDLTTPLDDLEGADEIVQLNAAAKQLQENLTRAMQTMKGTSDNLAVSNESMTNNMRESVQSVQSIDTAASELAKTASQQAKDTTDVAEEMAAINGIAGDSVRNAEKLLTACTDITKVTGDGKSTVQELTDITEKSIAAYTNIFEAIDIIDEKIKSIGAASKMISDIASQTNLLSLNASIEAARAGEAGKGFAVVAEEIGTLAQQSAASATTITNMINELINSSEAATNGSEIVKGFVERQKESVMQTKTVFNKIDESMNSVSDGVTELERVSTELGNRVSNVSELVESLSAASQENAATAEELSASTTVVTNNIKGLQKNGDEIADDSDRLNKIVGEYRM